MEESWNKANFCHFVEEIKTIFLPQNFKYEPDISLFYVSNNQPVICHKPGLKLTHQTVRENRDTLSYRLEIIYLPFSFLLSTV